MKNARALAREKKAADLERRLRCVNWKDLSFVGTELANMPLLYNEPFKFPELTELLSEGGALSKLTHPVYMFMISEPVYLPCEKILNVPVIVAYDCSVPPPSLVCHDSVQSQDASERALNPLGGRPLPMRSVNMAWVPYVPKSLKDSSDLLTVNPKFPVVHLVWEERKTKTVRMNEDQTHYLEYINPYIVRPQVCDELEKPEVRNVTFVFTHNGKKIELIFDKDIDRIATFIPETLEKQQLPPEAGPLVEAALRQAFKDARALADVQWEELQKNLTAISKEQRQALLNAKLYKIYPSHPQYDLTPYASPRINRYYGNADIVVGGKPSSNVRAAPAEEKAPEEAPAAAEKEKAPAKDAPAKEKPASKRKK